MAVNAISSILARLLNVGGLLWMFQYLLTRISTQEFAVYPVITAVMVFAPLFFSFFTTGVSRYIVDSYARNDPNSVPIIVSSILPPLGLVSAMFLIAGGIFAWQIEHILTIPPEMLEPARWMMALLVCSFSFQMLLLPFGVGFHVRQRYVELNLLGVARDILRVGLLFLLLTEVSAAVIWVVVATVVADMAHLIAVTLRSRVLTPTLRFRSGLYDRSMSRRLMSFGLWTTIGQLSNILFTNAATLVLNGYGTALDVTNYHVGATCFRQLQSLIILARLPLQPALVAMHAQDQNERLARTAFRGGRYGLWVAMAIATPLAIYSSEFIHLYLGDKFEDAGDVLILFMLTFPFTQPTVLLPMVAIAKARVRALNLAALISTFFGVLIMLAFTLIWELGSIGVTLSLVIVAIGSQVAYFWNLQNDLVDSTFSVLWKETLRPGLTPALVGGGAWGLLQYNFAIDSWLSLFLHSLAGGCVYLVTLFGFCMNASDKEILSAVGAKIRSRLSKR